MFFFSFQKSFFLISSFYWISLLVSVSRAFLDDDENDDKQKTIQTNDAVVTQYKELIREQASLKRFVIQIDTVGTQKKH